MKQAFSLIAGGRRRFWPIPTAIGRLLLLLCFCSLCAPALAATCSSGGGGYSVPAGTRLLPPDAVVGSIVIPKIGQYGGGAQAYSVSCPGDPNQDRDA